MGHDQLHPRVLRQVATSIAHILQAIFIKSLQTGEVPGDWKKAKVAYIFMKGSRKILCC